MATKDFSSKQEKMIADFLGWKVVTGSGARAGHPGDIIGDDWLGECKTHVTPNHPIFFSSVVWSKIQVEAIAQHRSPVLFTDDGSQLISNTWCIFPFFLVDDGWRRERMKNSFKINFKMNHSDLEKLYPTDDILNGIIDEPICYLMKFGGYNVAILPLLLFHHMFC